MVGTVTGKNSKVMLCAHSGGTWNAGHEGAGFTNDHSTWAIGDFSITFDRGTVEQDLLGEAGNYFKKGTLSVEGSLTAAKFGTAGYGDVIYNLCNSVEAPYKYLAVSGTISTDTDASYFRWCLASCQVTGFDVSIGDADTITEASIDFVMLNPQDLTFITADYSGVRG